MKKPKSRFWPKLAWCAAATAVVLQGFVSRQAPPPRAADSAPPSHAWDVLCVGSNRTFGHLQGAAMPSDQECRNAFTTSALAAWCGYLRSAWGYDELSPVSATPHEEWLGLAITAADSLGTLVLMGMDAQAAATAELMVARTSTFSPGIRTNVFEATIRTLGGLVSAHALTKDDRLLAAASRLAQNMSGVFRTPTGIPFAYVDLAAATPLAAIPHGKNITDLETSVSEAGSLSLEFEALTHAMNVSFIAPRLAMERIATRCESGLAPGRYIKSHVDGWGADTNVTISAHADSFYEYMLKSWIIGGKTEAHLLAWHHNFVHGVTTRLLARSPRDGFLFVGRTEDDVFVAEMEQLACFYPGLLALAHIHNVSDPPDAYADDHAATLEALGVSGGQMGVARELILTCMAMADRTATGLAPEATAFERLPGEDSSLHVTGADTMVRRQSEGFKLRPETVESLYVMHAATGDAEYKAMAWRLWLALERSARVPGGYTRLHNVMEHGSYDDHQV